jgi:fibronectin type 3 domain-containing protein
MDKKKLRRYVLLGSLGLLFAVIVVSGFLRRSSPEPHSVTLTWTAPMPRAGVTIVGYNVYRRTSESESFAKIGEKVLGPPYEDHLVTARRKYVYVVTAVDQTGRESRFSAEITAEIP